MINQIKILDPDILYVFNGRFASLRPAVRVAEMLSCPYVIHERAGVNGKYSLHYNNTPHNRAYMKQLIESFWNSSSKIFTEEAKAAIASKWFTDRRNGCEQGWYSYIENRKDCPSVNKAKTNIVIFNSSEHEFQAVSGWENPFYRSQVEGLYRLAKDLSDLDNVDIYLRVHPALSVMNNSQTKAIQRLKGRHRNFHVIDADSSINSYLVLDEADLVITFGSTMGIEATFWGKPSVLLGRATYEDLNATYTPSSHAEVVSLIKSKTFGCLFTDLELRKLGALKYGFFMQEYGIPFKLFDQHDYLKLTHKESGIHIEKGIHWQMRSILDQLAQTQTQLARMERRKFWKMRNLWLKVKSKLGMH